MIRSSDPANPHAMTTLPLTEVQARLAEVIHALSPGDEVVITENDQPVARLMAAPTNARRPVFGRGKGTLTIVSDDDEHLQDWADYLP